MQEKSVHQHSKAIAYSTAFKKTDEDTPHDG